MVEGDSLSSTLAGVRDSYYDYNVSKHSDIWKLFEEDQQKIFEDIITSRDIFTVSQQSRVENKNDSRKSVATAATDFMNISLW